MVELVELERPTQDHPAQPQRRPGAVFRVPELVSAGRSGGGAAGDPMHRGKARCSVVGNSGNAIESSYARRETALKYTYEYTKNGGAAWRIRP